MFCSFVWIELIGARRLFCHSPITAWPLAIDYRYRFLGPAVSFTQKRILGSGRATECRRTFFDSQINGPLFSKF